MSITRITIRNSTMRKRKSFEDLDVFIHQQQKIRKRIRGGWSSKKTIKKGEKVNDY